MNAASERLRSLNPYKDPELTNASSIILKSADIIDALVAALEEMRKEFREADLPYGSSAYLQSGSALAMARKGG